MIFDKPPAIISSAHKILMVIAAISVTLSIHNIFAAPQDTITEVLLLGTTNHLSEPVEWKSGGVAGIAPNADVGSMVFITQDQDLAFDTAIGNLGTLNLYGHDGRTIYVTAANSLVSIINDVSAGMVARVNAANGSALASGGAVAPKINLDINNAPLEITNNQLDKLGNINLTGSGALNLNFDDNATITSTITANNAGSILFHGTAGKTLTIKGRVGNNGNELALIEAINGGNIKLSNNNTGDSYISTIDIRGGDGNLILNTEISNSQGYKFNLLHDNGAGNIIISNEGFPDPISVSGIINSVISTELNPLNTLKFHGALGAANSNLVLVLQNQIYIKANAIETDVPRQGVMVFAEGVNIIDAPVGTGALPLAAIAVFENVTVETWQDVYLDQHLIDSPFEIALMNNSTFRIKANLTGDIVGVDTVLTGAPVITINGILEFINTAPSTLRGDIISLNTTRITNSDVTVNGNADSKLIAYTNNAEAILDITGDTVIGEDGVTTVGNNRHTIIFEGNVDVTAPIADPNHKMKNITFANDNTKTANISSNFYSNTITTDNSKLKLLQDSTGVGDMSGNNTNLNFGTKNFTYSGQAILGGNVVFGTSFDGVNGGHMSLLDANSILDFSGANSATVILTSSSPLPPAGTNYSYHLFNKNNGTINTSPVAFISNETNRFLRWSYNPVTYVLSAIVVPDVVGDVGNGNQNQVTLAQALNNSNLTGNAAAIQSNLGLLNSNQSANAVGSLIPVDTSGIALSEAVVLTEKGIEERISNVLSSFDLASEDNSAGVAAGDNPNNRHGVWINSFYGKSKQRPYGLNIGYSTKNYGATIGADTLLTDDFTLGGALTVIRTNVRHNDPIKGNDKGKADSTMLSVYGIQRLSKGYFLQGIGVVGLSKLDNVETRSADPVQIRYAQSKYDSKTYGAQLIGGRKFNVSQFAAITPMAGLRYNASTDGGYTETGAGVQNLTIEKKSTNSLEGIVGAKFTIRHQINGIYLEPQIHALANYNIKSKAPTMKIHIDGLGAPVQFKSQKSSKVWYAVNVGVDANSNRIDHGIFYELQLDKKYISHQGMLKFRYNF